jgi:outer membrane receptor protein involved in Fe transport
MSLDMFSAFELIQQGFVGYYGYDYLGNKLSSNVSFKDFFTKKDANGVRTFPVAAQQPLYIAGYIQDKFRYKDMIMSIGLRVDRFDANTKVLKDPYSLYEIMTAKEYYETKLKQPKPDNIGDDYLVYLTQDSRTPNFNYENKPDLIKAFRKGDQWYSNKGEAVNPDAYLGVGTKTYAKFKVDGEFPQIRSLNYDPDLSFADYKPQLNFMPRLAFSFPISDVANFFAHYDVLVARPSNNYVTALDYLFFDLTGRTPENNANLRPEKTIDYEVGFQQKLNETSGIKFAAYYKEMRDMIQLRFYKYITAPLAINEYQSFSNLDFGTVKGFTFQYDLRPTGHVSGNFNYTLQFADGTGSDAASQRDINRRNGNIRTLSPMNFDERHRFVFTVDYRYDDPMRYDGPKLFGAEIFKNAGANLQLITVSGRPYTKRQQPQRFGGSQLEGQINGARLPWTFNVDLRVDKTFSLSKNPKNPLDVNVYVRVQNLLDTRNVAGVYSATGSPDNDGYLESSFGLGTLENIRQSRGAAAVAAYQQSYLMRLLNPGNYYLPRRIFLGAIFNFN